MFQNRMILPVRRLALIIAAACCALCAQSHAVSETRPSGQFVSWGKIVVPEISADARFVAVATGSSHTMALKPDGTLIGWGSNSGGPLNAPAGLTNVIAVVAGGSDTWALRADGTVAGWGGDQSHYSTLLAGLTQVKSISLSLRRGIALREDGTIAEWEGRSPGVSAVPKPDNLTNVIAVAAGGRHSLALLDDGTVVGWGYNFTGQAVPPANAAKGIAIAAGDTYSIVLRDDRTVVGWGTIDFVVTNVVQMAAGINEAMMLQADGTMVHVGGSGRWTLPLDVAAVKQISVGGSFYMILYNDGTLQSSGLNDYMQAFTPPTFQDIVQISSYGNTHVNDVFAGENFIALRADGTVFGWSHGISPAVQAPTVLTNVISVAAGDLFSLALREDGTVVGWGSKDFGRLPVPADLTNATAIATHGPFSVALRSDGTVSAWGVNNSGQTKTPPGLSNVVAIATGLGHAMALRTDGGVVCWGNNSFKQTNTPPGLSNVIAIAAGDNHSLALQNDGTVVAWGDNSFQQAKAPAPLTGVVGIAGGSAHSLAYLADGSIVAWGVTNTCALPAGSTNRNILSVASLYAQTAAIVQSQPRIQAQPVGDGLELGFWGFQGRRYAVESTTELGSPWIEMVPGPVNGLYGWNTVAATDVASIASRFYRLRVDGAAP